MLSEKELVTYGHRSVLLTIYITTFLIGLPANSVAFYSLIKKRSQKATPIDILLLNLTISDLLFLLVLPCKIKVAIDYMTWKMPGFLCDLTNFIFYTTIYNSTFLLTAISVERYLGVAFPIKYKLKRRTLYANVVSVFFWIISMAHVGVVFFLQPHNHSNTTETELGRCYENFTQNELQVLIPIRMEYFLVLFCVPFLICCFCYIKLVWILSKKPNINPKKQMRAIGLSLGTLLVFIVCYAPYNVSHVEGFIKWESPSWRVDALLCSTINTCLDPIIYYFSSSCIRGTFCNLFKSLVERVQGFCGCCKTFYSGTQDNNPSSNDSL